MPQSGDGDLWPSVDGDEPRTRDDGTTKRMPVGGGAAPRWPAADERPEPAGLDERLGPAGLDERTVAVPRPPTQQARRPDQQRTQPVSWPPADVEQQLRNAWPPPEPPRAAPIRVGPPPPPDPEPEPAPPPRRRRKPLLITLLAIVVVAGVAAGVVFAVPGLAGKLGLTSAEEEQPIDPPAPPVEFTPSLRGPDANAPAPTAQGVQAALAGPLGDPALGTLSGIVIDPASGDVLWEDEAGTPLVPASTTKLLTAAAALLSLDHTEQLATKVVEGEKPGDVVIVGGGDPTLSSLKVGVEAIYTGAPHLSQLVDQVKASGVPVQHVYVDLDRYQGDSLQESWDPRDVHTSDGHGYIAPMVPAMLDGGRTDATVMYSPCYDNPAGVLVEEFANRIGATAPDAAEMKAPADAKVLGEVRSAPMVGLVDNLLRTSDNVLGEAIAREVARAAGEEVSFAGGSKATLDVLRENGFNVDGVSLADGSGLSTANKVPAKLLADILAVAAEPGGKDPRTAKLRPLLGGLPVAGGSGTLENRYTEGGATGAKGWVRAKTGSLSGVNSLAGMVLDTDGRPLVFALMSSGSNASAARPALDAVAAALRGCGCR